MAQGIYNTVSEGTDEQSEEVTNNLS